MTWRTAAKGAGVLGVCVGSVATIATSPVPLLVLGSLALLTFGPAAVVVLTATLSQNSVRQANAATVLNRLIIAVTANRWRSPELLANLAASAATSVTIPASNASGAGRSGHPYRELDGTIDR